jgi:predicted secreted protein
MGKAGFNCELLAGEDVVGKAKNVKLSCSAGTVDITTRSSAGWKEFIAGLKEWDISVDQLWISSDTALQAVRDAYLNGTSLAIKVHDAAGDGYGFEGTAIVSSLGLDQPLDGACLVPATLKGSGALAVHTPE